MPFVKGQQAHKGFPGAGGREKVFTPERIEEEADALAEWAEKPGNFYLKEFAWDRGYHPQRISEFERENIKFAEALKNFHDRKAAKIIREAFNGKVDMGWVRYFMPRLCRQNDDGEIWKAGWDKEHDNGSQPITVIINKQ